MPADRFFAPFTHQEILTLPDEEYRHARVMRLRDGDTLELINGQGSLATAQIVSQDKKEMRVEILSLTTTPPPRSLMIIQAYPRQGKLDVIVEKGTELGMTALSLFPGEYGERTTLSSHHHTRIQHQFIAALKQCGALYLPTLRQLPPIAEWTPFPHRTFFGDTDPHAPPLLSQLPDPAPLAFVVGPEKGFSPQEESHMRALGIQGVKLHPHILRTETAPLCALSLLSQTSI